MKTITSKVKQLFRTGFFHIFGSSIINKIIAFLTSVILVRILTKAEFGVFTYAWNIYSLIIIMNGMGIESGVLQVSSERSGNLEYANRVSNYGVRFGLKFNCILFVIILCVGLFAPLKIDGTRELLCMLCILPMAQLLFQLTTAYLRAQKRNQEFARLTVINTIIILVVSAIGAVVLREKGLILGYYIAYVSSFLIALVFFRVKLFNDSTALNKSESNALLKISAITMINNGLSQLMYLLDVFILGIIDPEETVLASYKVATMIPTALGFIPLALIVYLYPYFAEHQNDKGWCIKTYKQTILGFGLFNMIIAIILFFGAPIIIQIVFGPQYLDAVLIFRILSVNYFFSGTFRILSGNLLVTQRKLKFNLFVAIVSSIINIITDYLFIQWWGSVGAALATSLVVLVSSCLSTFYLIHVFLKKA